jgi:hypothetical protein
MTTEQLTAADFARTAGHVGTTAMEADILVAAEVVAPAVAPEVQAVLTARAAVAVAEAAEVAAGAEARKAWNFATMDAHTAAQAARSAAWKALRAAEWACYVPGNTPADDTRAKWARHQGIGNEIGAVGWRLDNATKKGQKAATARHNATIEALRAELAAFCAAHGI